MISNFGSKDRWNLCVKISFPKTLMPYREDLGRSKIFESSKIADSWEIPAYNRVFEWNPSLAFRRSIFAEASSINGKSGSHEIHVLPRKLSKRPPRGVSSQKRLDRRPRGDDASLWHSPSVWAAAIIMHSLCAIIMHLSATGLIGIFLLRREIAVPWRKLALFLIQEAVAAPRSRSFRSSAGSLVKVRNVCARFCRASKNDFTVHDRCYDLMRCRGSAAVLALWLQVCCSIESYPCILLQKNVEMRLKYFFSGEWAYFLPPQPLASRFAVQRKRLKRLDSHRTAWAAARNTIRSSSYWLVGPLNIHFSF